MQKSYLVFLLFAAFSLYFISQPRITNFQVYQRWKTQFGKMFSGEQDAFRRLIFLKNYQKILAHNCNPNSQYQQGLNDFSHLTSQQFTAMFSDHSSGKSTKMQIDGKSLSEKIKSQGDIDWTITNKVSPVKTQGNCDAGYAFSSVSLAESWLLFQSKNISLSQQQVIDCSESYTTFGCSGGSRAGTIKFITDKGLQKQIDYPYRGVKETCNAQAGSNKIAFNNTNGTGCDGIKLALSDSPLTVAVNARQWQSYKSGVFDGCDDSDVNHDILLVGVTSTYWKLKNSFGVKWGESGFIKLKIGNTCGICLNPAFGFKA